MTKGSEGRRRRFITLLALVALVAGCRREDPRVETLTVGISKDSVLVLMGGATAKPYIYLVDGKFIEAMIYPRPEIEGSVDSLARPDLMPIVLVDGRVTGWGWEYWDSVASAHRIVVEPRQ